MQQRHAPAARIQVPLFALLTALCVSGGNAADSPAVRVRDAVLADALLRGGAERIADYGAFQFLRLSAKALTASPAAADPRLEPVTGLSKIFLNAGTLDTSRAALRAAAAPMAPDAKALRLVQFVGPVKSAWRTALENTGVRIVGYVPNNAYLVYGTGGALERLGADRAIQQVVSWRGDYKSEYRVHPRARRKAAADLFRVQLVRDAEENAKTAALIGSLKVDAFIRRRTQSQLGFENIVVRLNPGELDRIARRPDVVSIQPYVPPERCGERQGMLCANALDATGSHPTGPGYLAWLRGKGFTQAQFDASGFVVDVVDDGFDNGNAANPANSEFRKFNNPAAASRMAYAVVASGATGIASPNGVDGHGNINISIVGGYNDGTGSPDNVDSAGYHYGLGICPYAHMASTKIFRDGGDWGYPDETQMVSNQYAAGCRISSDSWGGAVAGAYDVDSQNYDAWTRDCQPGVAGNQEMVFLFASGNDGPDDSTVGSPATAKNVIAVGAGENVNPSGLDGTGVTDAQADNARDMVAFSSRGPCADGRTKPEIVAPGSHIHGAASYAPAYNGNGVSDRYNPAGQTKYCESSGTSHSTPAVAGGAALVRQYFINRGWQTPSPAMTKAYLMNSTRYMTGVYAGDNLWSQRQGMGAMNLDAAFDDVPRILWDQQPQDTFTETGQERQFSFEASDGAKPVRITLAWTDAPGSTTGNAFNNDLDLRVAAGGANYLGNVFSGSFSATGGTADSRNNSENVWLPAGFIGPVTVTVTAANINSDGVPGNADTTDQDFALVMYNTGSAGPAVVADAATSITTNSALLNGRVSPGAGAATYHFEYGSTTNLGQSTPPAPVAANPASVAVSNQVDGLRQSTRYYYRLVASNGEGTNRSALVAFRTTGSPAPPQVATLAADTIGADRATLHGTVVPNYASTGARFEYGRTTAYGEFTPVEAAGAGHDMVSVRAVVTGLTADTTYHARLVASNALGTAAGTNITFVTMKPPTALVYEDFENGGAIPAGWTQEYVSGSHAWVFARGGADGEPPNAHDGEYNARFASTGISDPVTRLVSPTVDFGSRTGDPRLTFWHAMPSWLGDQDELRVYYRASPAEGWALLETYTHDVPAWTLRTITLPNPSATYSVAFEGTASWGHGVCIDDVLILGSDVGETPVQPRVSDISSDSPAEMVIKWDSAEGHVYRVEFTPSVADHAFSNLADSIPASPPVNTHTDHVGFVRQRYYRVKSRRN